MILAYHRINPWYRDDALTVSPAVLERQMAFLVAKGYRHVPLDYYLKPAAGVDRGNVFTVTFDDGYADNYSFAAPVLRKYDIRPVIFLAVGYIGTPELLPRYRDGEKDRFLNWDEVAELSSQGVVFGSHGLTHPRLTRISEEVARNEIGNSRKIIGEKLDREVRFFCYPFGDWNDRIAALVEEAGYGAAVVTARHRRIHTPYRLPRIGIYGHNNFPVFRLKTGLWRYS